MTKLRTANLLGALAGEVSERLRRQMARRPNETDSSAAALNVLSFWDGCSNAELARMLALSHPATVRLVDKLEAAGLVRSGQGQDRRAVALSLTEAGRERARAILADRCVALGEVVGILAPDEQAQLEALLEKLLRGVTTGGWHAGHICRLCDGIVCPEDRCPVHQKAEALEGGAESGDP
ncbi:MAG: MarR family transcriptional regulator [Phenylobacterium sp.]|uniref:MarR family winged helix-turn-helix transcriptional regulator n=1 Tax=Phenylobacterium sp. TaxID=1871053 RepID=UPI001A39B192|nr:MarR family transcriptional regulator [Phenylobacterium sp.]MBL8771875.1 MarR family transcriptional regulator [Phenylobacterium sp.]